MAKMKNVGRTDYYKKTGKKLGKAVRKIQGKR